MSAEPTVPTETGVKTSFVKEPQPEVPQEKKLTIPELLVKVYETEMYLAKQQKDTNGLLAEIRDLLAKQRSAPIAAPAQVAPAPVSSDPKMAKIVAALSEFKIAESGNPALTVNDTENNMFYIIRTNGFLGTDVFAKVAQRIKNDFGGEYVSQGRASHFRVSKA